MFNCKEKWQGFSDWKGWKLIYCIGLFLLVGVISYLLGVIGYYSICGDKCSYTDGKWGSKEEVYSAIMILFVTLPAFFTALCCKFSYFAKVLIVPLILIGSAMLEFYLLKLFF